MKAMINALYIPIGVPTFELVSARELFEKSVSMLRSICSSVICPNDILLSIDELNDYISDKEADLLIIQNSTFANAAYTQKIIEKFNCPALLWTLREPVIDGTRLRLNSLTGAFSAGNKMAMNGRSFIYAFGSPDEVRDEIAVALRSAECLKAMSGARLCQVGSTPEGFDFGNTTEAELMSTFGIDYMFKSASDLMEKARSTSEKEALPYLEKAKERISGLDTDDEHTMAFAKLYKAYSDFIKQNGINIIASRCWPDFFTDYGTPVCAVLAMLGDDAIPASCEADALGAVSMFIGQTLSGTPTFFGDPVSLDENESTLTFWHCGTAACSLARSDTGAQCGVHCNRKIGPTLEFGCRASERVTLFRAGRNGDGKIRFFVSSGEALDRPKQFYGTSVVVKTDTPVLPLVKQLVTEGFEPHYTVIYGDYTKEITALAKMLGVKIYKL